MSQLLGLETHLPGLYSSTPEALPFAPSLDIRAFLLRRDEGNLLLYSVGSLESEAAAIDDMGGVSRWYLNHRHEAAFASGRLSAPLFVHEAEAGPVSESLHVRGTFSRRHRPAEDFEVIPTPGHTPGATAYLWDSGHHRFLFTGDTILLRGGEWVAAVLGSSDRAAYIASLEVIRELSFDVLVPWAAGGGEPPYASTSPPDTRRRIDAIIARLRRGEGS